MRRLHAALVALFLSAVPLAAQPRPTLVPADYGRWQTLGAVELSRDGRWIAYEVRRVDEDVALHLRPTGADTGRVIPHARSAAFSADGRWAAYLVGASHAEEERAAQAQPPVRARLEVVELRTGAVHSTPAVASFQFSGDGRFLALRGYPPEGHEGSGFDLLVRDLETGLDTHFGSVAEYAWQDDGALLALVVAAHANAGNGKLRYVRAVVDAGSAERGGKFFRCLECRGEIFLRHGEAQVGMAVLPCALHDHIDEHAAG